MMNISHEKCMPREYLSIMCCHCYKNISSHLFCCVGFSLGVLLCLRLISGISPLLYSFAFFPIMILLFGILENVPRDYVEAFSL